MDPMIGQIELFPYGFAPQGWALCNGASISVMQNQALYSLIQNKFGGNTSAFNIPNLTTATPNPNMAYYIALVGLYPVRD